MKAGEDNPQAKEEEGKLSLLRSECNSSLAGIPGHYGIESWMELSGKLEGNSKSWDVYLPAFLYAYRMSLHTSMGHTP